LIKKFPDYKNVIEKLDKTHRKGKSNLPKFFFNLIYGFKKCKYCGDEAIFVSFLKGYKDYCNNVECYEKEAKNRVKEKYGVDNVFKSEEIKEKIKKINLEKYGVEWAQQSEEIKEKIKKSNLKKYGVENVSQYDEIKKKRKQTFIKKFGVDNPTKSEQIKEKVKQTNLKKYGVEWVFQDENIKEKIKETNIKKYGIDIPFKLESFQKKAKETMIKKYGGIGSASEIIKEKVKQTVFNKYGKWFFQTEEFKNKSKKSLIEKYGVEHSSKNEEIRKKISLTHLEKSKKLEHKKQECLKNKEYLNKEFIQENFVKNGYVELNKMTNFYNMSKTTAYIYLKRFGINYEKRLGQSNFELEIVEFLKQNGVKNIIMNTKQIITPYELDIVIPDKKIAIEFNRLMFHSYGKSKHSIFDNFDELDKKYHLNKTEKCEEKGYQLLHIFENEWIDEIKQKIWKSVILSKLGLIKNKIYARKCQIKEISNSEAYEFLETNHLQGGINAKINLGLFYNNELIAVMNFIKRRFDKKEGYELLRFASKININVIGGFSKLLKYFEIHYNPKIIISYANRRWSNGKVYEVNGFRFIRTTIPNYFYFKPNEGKIYSRMKFQKHNLYNILNEYDENKTELENMIDNGYRVIYDSGNKVYVKNYKEDL